MEPGLKPPTPWHAGPGLALSQGCENGSVATVMSYGQCCKTRSAAPREGMWPGWQPGL